MSLKDCWHSSRQNLATAPKFDVGSLTLSHACNKEILEGRGPSAEGELRPQDQRHLNTGEESHCSLDRWINRYTLM